jgi:hypothetical protein
MLQTITAYVRKVVRKDRAKHLVEEIRYARKDIG